MGQTTSVSLFYTENLGIGEQFRGLFEIPKESFLSGSPVKIEVVNKNKFALSEDLFVECQLMDKERKIFWEKCYLHVLALDVDLSNEIPQTLWIDCILAVRITGTHFELQILSPTAAAVKEIEIIPRSFSLETFESVLESLTDGCHLVVLVHGWLGSTHDLEELAKVLVTSGGENVRVFVTAINHHKTEDGIDDGGLRLAHQLLHIFNGKKNCKISFVGHSMGGLFARFCIGVLYQHNLFDWVECVNYVSIATPHSGVGSILPVFDVYENYMKPFFTGYAMSRSGSHLTLVDDDGKIGELRVPLLYAISCDGTCYMEGLKKFQKRILVSNFCNDMAVNYEGSSLVLKNDAHSSLDFDERSDFKILYFPLPSNSFQPLSADGIPVDVVLAIRENLRSLEWNLLVIMTSGYFFNAHNEIIVRRKTSPSIGYDVIETILGHMIQLKC
eukprot:TRINITY_DN1110_c0_g1_i10.p1 TRINITY_DN1110_c0_g1~~TRINITY_DN1110_c0_g1_i10.p1  ORF type:complete len:444 (-),score=103.44 TRINITY_DN1110_c0_g1_i10:281-1612(-)